MKRFCWIVALTAIGGSSCSRPGSIVGKWSLYLPPDTKAAAEKNRERIPRGEMVFRPDGTCIMTVDALGRKTIFTGTYKLQGTDLLIEGKETLPGALQAGGKAVENGVLSDDLTTLRIAGKDFYRVR